MTKQTSIFPYDSMIRDLIVQKSNSLLKARLAQSAGNSAEAQVLFEETAEKEEEIASILESFDDAENARISWVSTISCYLKAGKPTVAQRVIKKVLEQPLSALWKRKIDSVIRSELGRIQTEIELLLRECEELGETIAEFENRVKRYIEVKAIFLKTAQNQLTFFKETLSYLLNEIKQGKFVTQEELEKKIEELLNSFESFPIDDDVGEVPERFVEVSDGIEWEPQEIDQIEKETKTILMREYHRHVNRRDYKEADAQNWHRVHNLWEGKDWLLLAAYIICIKANNETQPEQSAFDKVDHKAEAEHDDFEQFNALMENLIHNSKIRQGLRNRIRNMKTSEMYLFAQHGEQLLQSFSGKLDEEIDQIQSQLEQLEAEIRNLTIK